MSEINRNLFIFGIVLCMLLSCFSGVAFAKAAETIVILYENDVHCEVAGYSKLAAMKNELVEDYEYVGVVSSGDFVQGGSLGAVSRGEYIVSLMNLVGYDAVTLGNHEFDYKLPRLNELVELMNTKPISCNFQKIGESKSYFEPYSIVSYGEVEIAYIGITTPSALSSSSPAQFKDEICSQYGRAFLQSRVLSSSDFANFPFSSQSNPNKQRSRMARKTLSFGSFL